MTEPTLAAACREVLDDPDVQDAPAGYSSLALCVMDAIWSLGVGYPSVANVVDKYRAWVRASGVDPAARTTAEMAVDIAAVGGPERFAADVVVNLARTSTRNGVLKAEAVAHAAGALADLGILTVDDMRERASDEAVERAWRRTRGQRSGISWHYLRILAGVDDVKADRMVVGFVSRALGRRVSAPEAYRLLVETFEFLRQGYPATTLRGLDHAVWTAERSRRRRKASQ